MGKEDWKGRMGNVEGVITKEERNTRKGKVEGREEGTGKVEGGRSVYRGGKGNERDK